MTSKRIKRFYFLLTYLQIVTSVGIFSNYLNKTILFLKSKLHATNFQEMNAKLELDVVCEYLVYKPI